MDIALVMLESWMLWFIPPLAFCLLIKTKSTYENYMPVICTVIMAFTGYLLGNMIELGHWCIPCVLSAVLALSTLLLSRIYPKVGAFLFAFFFPFLFYPLAWTMLPGMPELELFVIFSLWGLLQASRALKWKDNYNSTFTKAFASALILQSFILVLPRINLLKEDTFISFENTYHFTWFVLFFLLIIFSKLLDKEKPVKKPT